MNWRNWFRSLPEDTQEAYAKQAGTTANYIRTHLASDPPRKIPRRALMKGLADASDGAVSERDVLAHFFPAASDAAA